MYIKNEDIREFEDRIGSYTLRKENEKIGKFLDFEPEIEYAVGANGTNVYSPKLIDESFSDWRYQKIECENWIAQNKERVAKKGYATTKFEKYPQFHLDFNHLIEALNRLSIKKDKKYTIGFPKTTFEVWEMLRNECK